MAELVSHPGVSHPHPRARSPALTQLAHPSAIGRVRASSTVLPRGDVSPLLSAASGERWDQLFHSHDLGRGILICTPTTTRQMRGGLDLWCSCTQGWLMPLPPGPALLYCLGKGQGQLNTVPGNQHELRWQLEPGITAWSLVVTQPQISIQTLGAIGPWTQTQQLRWC